MPTLARIALGCLLILRSAWVSTSENQVHSCHVRVTTYDSVNRKLVEGTADVVVRAANGTVLFSGRTDSHGELVVPLDFRAFKSGDQIEARVGDPQEGFYGAFVSASGRNGHYDIVLPPWITLD